MSSVPRTTSELEQELKDQIELLKIDVANYDAGKEIVAKGIATKLRVLVHDTERSYSLLGQISKKGILFHDTAHEMDSRGLGTYSGLINISLSTDGAKYKPFLDNLPQGSGQQIEFEDWWNAVVFLDKDRNSFSRKQLVLALANQDGGAHVARELGEKYSNLSRQNSLNWHAGKRDGSWTPLANPHYAAIRQIAHEVLKSLIPGYTPPATSTRATFEGIQIAGMSMGIVGEPPSSPPLLPSKPAQDKVGRNDPCPCGSGKKYKKCHG
jgi:SEC-C motif